MFIILLYELRVDKWGGWVGEWVIWVGWVGWGRCVTYVRSIAE